MPLAEILIQENLCHACSSLSMEFVSFCSWCVAEIFCCQLYDTRDFFFIKDAFDSYSWSMAKNDSTFREPLI